MRNPNGYGSITKLSGNRRKPWRVRVTTGWEYDPETMKEKQVYANLGYFETKKDAMICLAKYNENPYDLNKAKVTFAEIWEKWFDENKTGMNKGTINALSAGFKKCKPLHSMKMSDIKKPELQSVLDSISSFSASTQEKTKTVMRNVFRYCMESDILEKDYTQFVKTNAPEQKAIHKSFTKDEIKALWDNVDTAVVIDARTKPPVCSCPVDTILLMIYTGMRPGELIEIRKENVFLENGYMVGGLKTKAGRNRIIPIHKDIEPLIRKRMEEPGEYLIMYKGSPCSKHKYRSNLFDSVMNKLKMDHLPHDGRHTFASIADTDGMKDIHIKRIMGHASNDITKDVYTHKDATELVDAINKINFK